MKLNEVKPLKKYTKPEKVVVHNTPSSPDKPSFEEIPPKTSTYWLIVENKKQPIPHNYDTIPDTWDIQDQKELDIFCKATGYPNQSFQSLEHQDLVDFMQDRMIKNNYYAFDVLKTISSINEI